MEAAKGSARRVLPILHQIGKRRTGLRLPWREAGSGVIELQWYLF
jgi:hypothetical protein